MADLADYTIAVLDHLNELEYKGPLPTGVDLAAARDSGVSPRKFAEFLVRRNA